jgi:uncharacterized membrane protein
MDRKDFLVLCAGIVVLAPIFLCFCSDSFLLFVFGLVYGVFLLITPKASTRMRKFWKSYAKYDKELWKSFLVR